MLSKRWSSPRANVAAFLDTQFPTSEIMDALELHFGVSELILQEKIQALKDYTRLIDNTLANSLARYETVSQP